MKTEKGDYAGHAREEEENLAKAVKHEIVILKLPSSITISAHQGSVVVDSSRIRWTGFDACSIGY